MAVAGDTATACSPPSDGVGPDLVLLDWGLPDDDVATIAGLVLHEARRIPDPGQVFVFHGFRFEVLERQRNQVRLLKIMPPDPATAASAA